MHEKIAKKILLLMNPQEHTDQAAPAWMSPPMTLPMLMGLLIRVSGKIAAETTLPPVN